MQGYPEDQRTPGQIERENRKIYGDFEFPAARVIARLTGARVLLQDDNSKDAIPDIRLEYDSGTIGVGEVTVDIDGQYAAMTSGLMKDPNRSGQRIPRPVLVPDSGRTWFVGVSGAFRLQCVDGELPELLVGLEKIGQVFEQYVDFDQFVAAGDDRTGKLVDLGVVRICSRVQTAEDREQYGGGVALLHPEGASGYVEDAIEDFGSDLNALLRGPKMKSKVDKLNRANADERHLFLGTSYSSPWSIHYMLSSYAQVIPDQAPELPAGVTHLWLMDAQWPGVCLLWSSFDQWLQLPGRTWLDTRYHWATG
jgi:hypothetical protein